MRDDDTSPGSGVHELGAWDGTVPRVERWRRRADADMFRSLSRRHRAHRRARRAWAVLAHARLVPLLTLDEHRALEHDLGMKGGARAALLDELLEHLDRLGFRVPTRGARAHVGTYDGRTISLVTAARIAVREELAERRGRRAA